MYIHVPVKICNVNPHRTHYLQGNAKKLPRTSLRFDEEPSDVLCSFLYEITGGDRDGLKGMLTLLSSYISNLTRYCLM